MGLLNFGGDGSYWNRSPVGKCWRDGSALYVSWTLVAGCDHSQPLHVQQAGDAIALDLYLPTGRPGSLVRCRIETTAQTLFNLHHRIHHQIHRRQNHQHSTWAIAGMVLLLSLCGFIVGGSDGARLAVAGSLPRANNSPISRESLFRRLGARRLRPSEMPELFRILTEVSRRAQLSRMPELYCLPTPTVMNAYACGDPDDAAIIVTEGLLRGMSVGEIAGILAHEVAHIRNQDAWAMDWASMLNRAIEWIALIGLAALPEQGIRISSSDHALGRLLSAAPAIGRLLFLALSRARELDADATAFELTGDMHALVAALAKLEHHHTGSFHPAPAALADSAMRLLRSHPATSERVGALLGLVH